MIKRMRVKRRERKGEGNNHEGKERRERRKEGDRKEERERRRALGSNLLSEDL